MRRLLILLTAPALLAACSSASLHESHRAAQAAHAQAAQDWIAAAPQGAAPTSRSKRDYFVRFAR